MRKPALFCILAAICGMASAPAQQISRTALLNPGDHTRTVTSGGLERSYIIHIPKTCGGDSGPHPAVLVFHGGGSNAGQWMPFCGLNETADREGFISVYPDGTGKTVQNFKILGWNGGPRRPGGGDAKQNIVDDVAFTKALLDDLEMAVKVDPNRVYAAGMSMGAIMVYRLASELSGRIAAIAAVAGSMGTETCNPERPVSVLHLHGTEDEAVPFNGGRGKLDPSQTDFLSVKHSITAWIKANGCSKEPTIGKAAGLGGGRYDSHANRLWRRKRGGGSGSDHNRGRRAHVAGAGVRAGTEGAWLLHQRHLRQSTDVGVFQKAPPEAGEHRRTGISEATHQH